MISTAGTVCEAARLVMDHGADRVIAAATHAVLVGPAIERLRSYPFPGNVRELENAIERAVTFASGEIVEVADLPARIRDHGANGSGESGGGLSPLLSGPEELPSLDEIEHRYIEYVLKQVDGNKRRAARLLGIGRKTLYRKLDDETQQ